MIHFFTTYWDSILTAVLFVTACVVLIRRGGTQYVRQMLFYLVTRAEAEYGAGTGSLKYAAVTTWAYERLPAILRLLFSAKQLDALIEDAVQAMKGYLVSNKAAVSLVSTQNEMNSAIPIQPNP